MKKALVLSVVAMIALSLTACGENTTSTKTNAITEARHYEVATEEAYDVIDLEDFDVLLKSIREDPDVGSSVYQIYLEKVAVQDDNTEEKEEVILASHIELVNSDGTSKVVEKAIAAPYAYIDPYREDGKFERDAQVEWKFEDTNGKGAYTATSIIDLAMQYANITEDDLESYQKYTVVTNETNKAN